LSVLYTVVILWNIAPITLEFAYQHAIKCDQLATYGPLKECSCEEEKKLVPTSDKTLELRIAAMFVIIALTYIMHDTYGAVQL
jgi:hypothetical protein